MGKDILYSSFIDLLEQEFSNSDLNIEAISKKLLVDRSYLFKAVKSATGKSPVMILKIIRLEKARLMLTTTDEPIKYIAYQCGFSSPAYFSKCYKLYFGETPSEVRNKK